MAGGTIVSYLPVAEITGYDTECIWLCEVRCEKSAEFLLCALIDGADHDRYDADVPKPFQYL